MFRRRPRDSRNAPTVTATASSRSDPSRSTVFGPSCSLGPKHPQLIDKPRAYVRTMSAKNPVNTSVATSEENLSAIPLSSQSPRNSSNGGKKWATRITCEGASN